MGRRRGRKQSRAEAYRRELPPDVIFSQILPRLQVNSVLRFKCVSKEWHSFLTTPAFAKMHFQHHVDLLTPKLVALSESAPYNFCTIDCERPEQGSSASRPLPFKVQPGQLIRILTSVHGLVCIGIGSNKNNVYHYSDLILWNPATGDHKTLSKPLAISQQNDCYETDESLFGLYHSSWDDDYMLLRVTHHSFVYVYSLKSDSWRKVESDIQLIRRPSAWLPYLWWPSVSLHENLYFLERNIMNTPYSILRFNTKTEILKVIATPFYRDGKTTWLSFTKRDGYIELLVNIQNPVNLSASENELWRMEGYGDWINLSASENELWRMEGDGDWTKVESSSMILIDPYIKHHERPHLMRSGHLLMYHAGSVYKVDIMKTCSNTNRSMHVWAGGNAKRSMHVCAGGKHIETMVSPNQYVK